MKRHSDTSTAMPTAMPINAGPNANMLEIGTSLIVAKPSNSVCIAGAAMLAAMANGTSATPNAPIAIAPGIINGSANPSTDASTPNPVSATKPFATSSQLKLPNTSNAFEATNIAPDITNSAAEPINALGLPNACSPLPKPVNVPCNKAPIPLPTPLLLKPSVALNSYGCR